MTVANKHDEGKLRYDLLPVEAIREVVRVLTYGAVEYGDRNWEKGMKHSRLQAARLRHNQKYWGGEDYDKDSGLLHLAHETCTALMALQYQLTGTGEDDRPLKNNLAEKSYIKPYSCFRSEIMKDLRTKGKLTVHKRR